MCSGAGLTLAWLMIRPMNVDTSLDRDNDGLFRCSSCLSRGKAVGSSGTVTVYECRRLGMAALLNVVRYQDGGDIHSEIPAAGWSQYSGGISGSGCVWRLSVSAVPHLYATLTEAACVGVFTASCERLLPPTQH